MSKAKTSEQKEKKQLKNVQEQSSDQTQQGNNKLELDIRINRIVNKDNLRAMASVNFNKCFAITNIRVMESDKGFFLGMPCYKTKDGEYKDICFPIDNNFRKELTDRIQEAYILKLQEEEQEQESVEQSAGMQM